MGEEIYVNLVSGKTTTDLWKAVAWVKMGFEVAVYIYKERFLKWDF